MLHAVRGFSSARFERGPENGQGPGEGARCDKEGDRGAGQGKAVGDGRQGEGGAA